ncbi:MAG: hypothetical protein HYW07_08575, partial [Candidatus Latescibacteria bacterium]|nr:hypothetical protein [Candidatus Latescibacterota bacterium]
MAKSLLSKRGKQESKKHQQKDVRQYRENSRKRRIANREGVLIYVPVQSFLPGDEQWWITFINKREWWDKDADHIIRLLNRYLDTLGKASEEREQELQTIASEITERMRIQEENLSFGLSVNRQYSPEGDKEAMTGRPFLFAAPGGIVGYYISLARFLGGEYARRLKRCKHCRGLFIAPNEHQHEFCPLTDHKRSYWREERTKTNYHAHYMAQKRDPKSP